MIHSDGQAAQRPLRREDEEPVGAAIRRIVGADGYDLQLPERDAGMTIDFSSTEFGDER